MRRHFASALFFAMAKQPPQLVAISEGPTIVLDKPIILIGRHQECDIQIPSRKISRRHCCVAQVNDQIVVRDLCSTNGICINGTRVKEGTLKHGDELTVGEYRYQLQCLECADSPQVKELMAVAGVPEPTNPGQDQFDSCDEPVALPEAGAAPAHAPPPAADKPRPSGLRLPDNLTVAALSDSALNSPK